MRRIAGAAVMAVVTALSLVAVAAAHTVMHESEVKLSFVQGNTFKGEVEAGPDPCEAGRVIKIYRVTEEGPDEFLSTTETDANGRYEVTPLGTDSGTYYAVVLRKVIRNDATHRHICSRDVSPERVVVVPEGPPGPR